MEREQPLPTEPLECRQIAEASLLAGNHAEAVAWTLLAISGQLAQLLRQQGRR